MRWLRSSPRGVARLRYGAAARAHAGPPLERPGRAARVVGLGDRAHDDDAPRARVEHLVDGGRVDPADGEPRHRRGARRVRDRAEADRRAALLRRRRVDGADGEVVDALGRVGLRLGVRRQPDDPVVADERARLGDRRVVLADVHAVGAGPRDEVGAVVEDEQRARLVAQLARDLGRRGGPRRRRRASRAAGRRRRRRRARARARRAAAARRGGRRRRSTGASRRGSARTAL